MRIGTVVFALAIFLFFCGVVVSIGPPYYREKGREEARKIYLPRINELRGKLAEAEWERDVARGIARDTREELDATLLQLQRAEERNDSLRDENRRLGRDNIALRSDTSRLQGELRLAVDSIKRLQTTVADSASLLRHMREDSCEKEMLLSSQSLLIDTLRTEVNELGSQAARTYAAEKRARGDRSITGILSLLVVGWLLFRGLHSNHPRPNRRQKKPPADEPTPKETQLEPEVHFTSSLPLQPSIFLSRPIRPFKSRRFL